MAAKKKTGKKLGKKDMRKTKGGVLIALNQPALKLDVSRTGFDPLKVDPGSLNFYKP